MLGTSSLNRFFKSISVLIRSHTTSQTPVDDNLDHDFDTNDWIIEADEPQALEALVFLLSTPDLLNERKHDQFCEPILVTKASDPNSKIYEGDGGLLRHRHPSTSRQNRSSYHIVSEEDCV